MILLPQTMKSGPGRVNMDPKGKLWIFFKKAGFWVIILFFLAIHPAWGADPFLPSFGQGPVKLTIYTDYFCPPCRSVEPQLEPLIMDLMKKEKIHLTFVDTPIHPQSPLYARYFLYALNVKRDFHHALFVRNTLFSAAESQVLERKNLEDFLRAKGIVFMPFNINPILEVWNRLLNEDKIESTPSVVIHQGIKKELHKGSADIIKALSELK